MTLLTGSVIVVALLALEGILPVDAVDFFWLPLGPIGVVVALFTPVPYEAAGHADTHVNLLFWVIVVPVVSVLNVLVARRARVLTTKQVTLKDDRLVSVFGFLIAGATFVLMCPAAGYVAVIVQISINTSQTARSSAPFLVLGELMVGLAVAVVGLVIWVLRWRSGKPTMRYAIGAAGVQGVLFLYATVGTLLLAYIGS